MKPLAAIIAFCLGCLAAVAMGADYAVQCPPGGCPLPGPMPYQPAPQWQPSPLPIQPPQQQTPPSPEILGSIVRIDVDGPSGGVQGSGTIVEVSGEYGLVISCHHLFQGGQGQCSVRFRYGQPVPAEYLASDAANDLSAFSIKQPGTFSMQPVALAAFEPAISEACTTVGYGPGQLAYYTGRFLGPKITRLSRVAWPIPVNEFAGSVRPGDSGGPVLNAQQQLCGTIIGTNSIEHSTIVSASRCLAIHEFLGGVREKWRARFGGIGKPIEPPPLSELPPKKQPGKSPLEDIAKAGGTWGLTQVLTMIGLGAGPAGLLASGMMWFGMRRLKKRLAAAEAAPVYSPQPQQPAPTCRYQPQPIQPPPVPQQTAAQPIQTVERRIIEPAPPAPVVVDERHHNLFSYVPENTEGKAWARAIQIYVMRYPGAETTLQKVSNLKDQILKGEPVAA